MTNQQGRVRPFLSGPPGRASHSFLRLILRDERPNEGRSSSPAMTWRDSRTGTVPALRRKNSAACSRTSALPNKTSSRTSRSRLKVIASRGGSSSAWCPRSSTSWLEGKHERLPDAAVRRWTAAGRDGPRVRQPADDPARRRADGTSDRDLDRHHEGPDGSTGRDHSRHATHDAAIVDSMRQSG